MLTVDEYCDKAKKRNDIKSDRKLAEALSIAHTSLNQYRTKRAWPSDNTMIKLAKLAGLDPTQSLLYLSAWRTTGEALELYKELADEHLRNNAKAMEQMLVNNT